jgi:hypothetical protein
MVREHWAVFEAIARGQSDLAERAMLDHLHTVGLDLLCLSIRKRVGEGSRPGELNLHLIVNNYATHKHPAVGCWLSSSALSLALPAHVLLVAQFGRSVVREPEPDAAAAASQVVPLT